METTHFWARLDARVRRLARELGQPLRGTLSGLDGLVGVVRGRAGDSDDEVLEGVELGQHYGFASRPASAEVVTVAIGGAHGHRVIVAELDHESRPELEEGETALYASTGAVVILKKNGDIEITPKAGSKVLLAGGGAGVARVGDAVSVSGTVTVGGAAYPVTATAQISAGSSQVESG